MKTIWPKNFFLNLIFISIAGFFICNLNTKITMADQYSKPLAINSHIRMISYSANEMHHYVGFYGYAANILFEDGEEIGTIAMGDPQAWQIIPNGNRLFIKPLQDNPSTNAMIITNRRVYHFSLEAREATSLHDKDLVFETRFIYPETSINNFANNDNISYIPDIADQDNNLNFNYLVSGNNRIKPIRVFDDGKFTYIQFHPKSNTMPAVFLVEEDGYESLVNVRTVGKYLVIEKTGSLFTLRYDKIYACIFNQQNPFIYKKINNKTNKKTKKSCK